MATITLTKDAGADKEKRVLFPIRKKTGTADFHLSTAAVGFGIDEAAALSEIDAVFMLANERWGSVTEWPCPHCNTIDNHKFTRSQRRWKCNCCDSRFSVTSGTVFADHKLSLVIIIKIALSWANGASGVPSLHLRYDWNVAYATVFTLTHKLREGIVRALDRGPVAGTNEMDGMDVNGRRYKEKRNVPHGTSISGKPKVPAYLLKKDPAFIGPPLPVKFEKTAKQNDERRIALVMSQRGVSDGKGSSATRICPALKENTDTVTAMATKFASAESIIMSDEDPAYTCFRDLFAGHKTINHSVGYSDGKGTSNNQAESVNARLRKLVEQTYSAVSNKYLTDYASECAWRVDVRRLSTGEKIKHLFRTVLAVGQSRWWRGYTHGHHRKVEMLIEGDQPALGRGRQEGWKERTAR
jgi:transposase-like protein